MKGVEVYLHIGTPKTATTSMQQAFFHNNELLYEALSIDYAPPLLALGHSKNATGHHSLAWDICEHSHEYAQSVDHDVVARYIRETNADKLLLSSEWFSLAKPKHIKALVEQWQLPEKRHIVIVRRNEFDYVCSRWLQSIKMGHTFMSFKEYYMTRYKPQRTPLSKVLEPWKQYGFNAIVLSFDDLKSHTDVSLGFIHRVFGKELSTNWNVSAKANQSPKPAVVERYRKLIRVLGLANQSVRSNKAKLLHDWFCKYPMFTSMFTASQFEKDQKFVKADLSTLPTLDDC